MNNILDLRISELLLVNLLSGQTVVIQNFQKDTDLKLHIDDKVDLGNIERIVRKTIVDRIDMRRPEAG